MKKNNAIPGSGKRHKNKGKRGLAIILSGLLLMLMLGAFSCAQAPAPRDEPSPNGQAEDPEREERDGKTPKEREGPTEEQEKQEAARGEIPPAVLEQTPNELGEFMVLMYHEIGHPESEWVRTPDNFRRDLETLYERGYRAVNLIDAVQGNIDIPAGTSPVVLTFDDGNRGNFYFIEENGEPVIDPDCAVGILLDFYEENPDFGLAGTFYIFYPNPFRQPEYVEEKLQFLVEKGFEIGNHTHGHQNLARISPEGVRRELALHVRETQKYIPGYEVQSLALPYGAYPANRELVVKGSYDGIDYRNEAVLLVGANPAPSPFHQEFDPLRLPRVRASEMKTEGVGMYDWLERFEENPRRRYVSDGDPRYVTAPESLKESLDESGLEEKTVRFYKE